MGTWWRVGRAARGVEVGLGVLGGAAVVVTAGAIRDSWGGGWWIFGAAVGVLVCGLALARRAHRLVAAVAGLGVAGVAVGVAAVAGLPHEPGPATTLGLSVLVASAVRALPARPAVTVAALGGAVVAGSALVDGFGPVPVLAGAGWLVGLAGGLGWRLVDQHRRELVAGARRAERRELARELHDVAAHHLTGIVLQAQAAPVLARRHPERLPSSLAEIETAGSDALAAMRRVVGILRDPEDAPETAGPERLAELVRRFTAAGRSVRLRQPADTTTWPPEVSGTVYRVVRESLTNVARHAPRAGSVSVLVTEEAGAITVEVADDGAPSAAPSGAGYGLIGMRERVEALGGSLRAGPRPAGGWSVVATLPLPGRAAR
ncbi:sensor histidine kinase [Micromonospora sp. PLK6-60]|uniref:sensor histidine kinase n=1 Tax=Micromonospora sp. PLK6-60 TaxID=2873383 RepID=UPI001CA71C1A|nr:histidine kinase [Micromonospora sp. PLK6-60]MBY8874755.1 sensor histidine kinase [Micromonospora sp. PLK6-60]